MKSIHRAIASLALIAGLLSAPAAALADTANIAGVWRNPKDSVRLEIKDCGPSTCGYVVYASPGAQADARKGGNKNMVGMQLLRDFVQQKDGNWRGKVYVPSLNMTFAGTAEFINAGALRARGCVIGNLLCKSQVWTRIS